MKDGGISGESENLSRRLVLRAFFTRITSPISCFIAAFMQFPTTFGGIVDHLHGGLELERAISTLPTFTRSAGNYFPAPCRFARNERIMRRRTSRRWTRPEVRSLLPLLFLLRRTFAQYGEGSFQPSPYVPDILHSQVIGKRNVLQVPRKTPVSEPQP